MCVGCGKCFTDDDRPKQGWSGKRCPVCVACGECAKAWGILPSEDEDVDAVSGPTSWADAFKVMDTGSAGAPPPVLAAPGESSPGKADPEKADSSEGEDIDASTGATPGVATACKELGLDDMDAVLTACNIKPPGQA